MLRGNQPLGCLGFGPLDFFIEHCLLDPSVEVSVPAKRGQALQHVEDVKRRAQARRTPSMAMITQVMAKFAGRSTQRLRGQHNMMLATVSADANYFTTTPPKQIHTWLRGLCGTRRHGRAQEHQYQSWYRSTTQAVSVWVTLSSCEATPPHLQQRNVVIGRRFTTSGEGMENNQQPTSTTT